MAAAAESAASLLSAATTTTAAAASGEDRTEEVETARGVVRVRVDGKRTDPEAIFVFFHDIGLDHEACFGPLLADAALQPIFAASLVLGLTAPGQEDAAPDCDFGFPTVADMADQVHLVLRHFNARRVIGIGAGLGGAVLTHYTARHPGNVRGLVLVSCPNAATFGWAGWMRWHYRASLMSLGASWATTALLPRFFSYDALHASTPPPSIADVKAALQRRNGRNLVLLMDAYRKRPAVSVEALGQTRCKVLLINGSESDYSEEMVLLGTEFPRASSTLLTIESPTACGGLVTREAPHLLREPLLLFLQGLSIASAFPRLPSPADPPAKPMAAPAAE